MGIDEDVGDAHQGRQTHGVAGVLHEHQEGAGKGAEAAVQGHAVANGRHAELAHAETEIAAVRRVPPPGVVGAGQIRRAAEQLRQGRGQGIQTQLRGLAGGQGPHFRLRRTGQGFKPGGPALRQPAGQAPFQLRGQGRMGRLETVKAGQPLGLPALPLLDATPIRVNLRRHLERPMRPAEGFAGGRHLIFAQGSAMHGGAALLVGGAEADDGLDADQGGPPVAARGRVQGRLDVRHLMSVHAADDAPAVACKARRHVFREPGGHLAVDGDAVVVVQADQLAQAQSAGQGRRLMGDALHQAAVAHHHPGAVVDHLMAGPVELRRQPRLRQGHAHCIGEALPQGAGGGLHAGTLRVFRVPGGLGAQLPERLQILLGDRVAAQVQQAVQQHGAMPVGQHEAVAVGPGRVLRIVDQHLPPQHLGHIGQPHRRPRVPGIGALHGIHGEGPNGVGPISARRHFATTLAERQAIFLKRLNGSNA